MKCSAHKKVLCHFRSAILIFCRFTRPIRQVRESIPLTSGLPRSVKNCIWKSRAILLDKRSARVFNASFFFFFFFFFCVCVFWRFKIHQPYHFLY